MFDGPERERALGYLLHLPYETMLAERAARVAAYRASVEADRERFPPRAYEFALAEWHYDHRDHRCPHDAWVESLLVKETASGTRQEIRAVEISVRLLGPYHDGAMSISYPGVRRYSLFQPHLVDRGRALPVAQHGDWLVDEVSASNHGRPEQRLAIHEIEFANGGIWTIEAEDVVVEWHPNAGK